MIDKDNKVRRITLIAIISAAAFLLMLISIPIIPYMSFLKLDLSDIPILLGLLLMGPEAAIEATVLKLFLYWMVMGFSLVELIGLISSFAATLVLIIVFWLTQKYLYKSVFSDVWIVMLETILLTLVSSALNLFVVTPLYINFAGLKLDFSLPKMILYGIIPFNIIKGIIVGSIFVVISRAMKRWIKN